MNEPITTKESPTPESIREQFNLTVLYEDNHVIVVLKPQNLPSCPDSSGDDNLLDRIKRYVKTAYNKPGNVYKIGRAHV